MWGGVCAVWGGACAVWKVCVHELLSSSFLLSTGIKFFQEVLHTSGVDCVVLSVMECACITFIGSMRQAAALASKGHSR